MFDRNGNQTVVTSTVQVQGNAKPGLFTLSYQDLNLPAAGIPVTVTRTYDSRDKAQGDFGVGWRLGFNTIRLRTNRVPGTGWVRGIAGAVVSLAPTSEHKVSVTLPDGKVEEFDLHLSPTSNLGGLDATVATGYAARSGTVGKLEMLDNPNLLILNGGAEDELVDDTTLNTFNPTLYRYTTLDGTQIIIHRTEGVKKITDRNGNSVTFGVGGIVSSSGKSVAFARDAQGRITQITDALGNVQTYGYDGNGDLVSHMTATGVTSHYAYDYQHNLIDILDPMGNHAVRNEYDTAGHLISTTDANGQTITYSINLAAQSETIIDRLGHVSQVQYDAQGNVTSTQRSVTIAGVLTPVVATMTYDALNNKTSAIDADGRLTASTFTGVFPQTTAIDPAGLNLTTTYAYDGQNNPTTVADSGGKIYSFTYDGSGNMTGLSTPTQGAVAVVLNSQGQSIRSNDALGTQTVYTYDSSGNVSREDALDVSSKLLRRIDYTYDANGNKTSETLYRTVGGVLTPFTTWYTYDGANRVVTVVDQNGGVLRTEYDAIGNVTAEADALGRRTTYTYTALNQLTQTTYPDGTFETRTYDSNRNLGTQTDAAGRTTTFSYDELNRQVKVTLADGSSTQTVYSPGGQVMAEIDANGNRTNYAYDTAGRRIMTILPSVQNGPGGPVVQPQINSTLNANGRPASITDPNGHITAFQYDANGRITRTTYPDSGYEQQTWDALGRRTSVTNEEGQVTNFNYDGLGRLLSVSGLAGNATYAYDEASNLVTQTDALGRATQFGYDSLNRLTTRLYPGGETEMYAYDAVGNMVAHTDGLGRIITYTYDVMNRVMAKTLPGGQGVNYAYQPDGQRKTVTDARGNTTYSYDSVGRLASVVQPTGEMISYARDGNDNLLSLTSPAATVDYSYDALNRLIQVAAPEGVSQSFYDLVSNRLRQTLPNGLVNDVSFDTRNRPSVSTNKTAGGTLLQSYNSVYSAAGRLSKVTELDGSIENFTYDANGRLASEVRTGTNPLSITDSYDAVGNRLQNVSSGTPTLFTYDDDDHLLSDGAATYAWDADGNLVSRTQGANVVRYGYDPEDKLTSIQGAGIANQYGYDDDGNRVEAVTASGTRRFLIDSENNTQLSQVLEETDGSGSVQAHYSYGNDLLAMNTGGGISFPVRDPLGSTSALTNPSGAITDRYQYDAYGNTIASMGGTVNPYRYRGERIDADSGLYQMRARYYNPAQGRFVSRDPFAGLPEIPASRHRYAYAGGDPLNHSDPTGTEYTLGGQLGEMAAEAPIDAISIGAVTEAACGMKSVLDVIEVARFVDNLAEVAFAAVSRANGAVGKGKTTIVLGPKEWTTGFGKYGIDERISYPPLGFSGNLTVDGVTFSLDSSGSFSFSHTAPIYSINMCGFPAATLYIKPKFKATPASAPSKGKRRHGPNGAISLSFELRAEVNKSLRFEWPFIDADLNRFQVFGVDFHPLDKLGELHGVKPH